MQQESIASGLLRRVERDGKVIGKSPTVDAVEVVRCRDCKHYKPDEYECGCDFAGGLPYVKADDFCSYGERRDYD